MRIGMLLMGGAYPPDIRVLKEAKVLRSAGHDIFLLTSDRDGRAAVESLPPLEVRRYPARAGLVASKWSAAVTIATWRSPLWQREIERFVAGLNIEALHVHDLPAVASALAVARRAGIPVTFDMHENYPAAVGFWNRSRTAELLQTPARYREYERRALREVDRIVVVVDESRDRIVSRYGVDPAKVHVFGNVDDVSQATDWIPDGRQFVVAYAGGFGPHRGLDTLIRSLPELRRLVPDARLVLLGRGHGEAELRMLADSMNVADAIEWTGWVDELTMRAHLSRASVGVVPHERNEHTDSTVPHKLFQYMAIGLPITVTDCAPLARIVRETGAGTVARAGDPADLARALADLSDIAAAKAASEAGKAAVRERYNLVTEGRSLVALYERLAAPQ